MRTTADKLIRSFGALLLLLSIRRGAAVQTGSGNTSGDGGGGDDEIQLRYRIEEEIPRGTLVGNVVDDARLRTRYPPAAMSLIRFRFLSTGDSSTGTGGAGAAAAGGSGAVGHGLFEIGLTSGIIRTTGDIDRDSSALCRQKRHCAVNIDVIVQPVQYFRIIKVSVVCMMSSRPRGQRLLSASM